MGLLEVSLDPATVIVAVDPGKVMKPGPGQQRRRSVGRTSLVVGRVVGYRGPGEDARDSCW